MHTHTHTHTHTQYDQENTLAMNGLPGASPDELLPVTERAYGRELKLPEAGGADRTDNSLYPGPRTVLRALLFEGA